MNSKEIKKKKQDRYLELARDPRKNKLWKMKVTVIPVIVGIIEKFVLKTRKEIVVTRDPCKD